MALRLAHLQQREEHGPIFDLVGKGRAFRIISLVRLGGLGPRASHWSRHDSMAATVPDTDEDC